MIAEGCANFTCSQEQLDQYQKSVASRCLEECLDFVTELKEKMPEWKDANETYEEISELYESGEDLSRERKDVIFRHARVVLEKFRNNLKWASERQKKWESETSKRRKKQKWGCDAQPNKKTNNNKRTSTLDAKFEKAGVKIQRVG
jgi:hypothetical protein